jgi:hypothetical protein
MHDARFQLARTAFDKAIAARADTLVPFTGAAFAPSSLGDSVAAFPGLERAVGKKPTAIFIVQLDCSPTPTATGQNANPRPFFDTQPSHRRCRETYLNFMGMLSSRGLRRAQWIDRKIWQRLVSYTGAKHVWV